jgi:hypothetical protein
MKSERTILQKNNFTHFKFQSPEYMWCFRLELEVQ